MTKRAFTLLEMLVAVAIVAVLAALILAATQSAREQAASAQCIGQLRQWGVALNLYANENDGLLPRRGQGVQPVFQIDRPTDWFNALPPYLGLPSYAALVQRGERPRPGTRSIFVCPSARDDKGANFLPYGMNMYLSPWNRPEPHRRQELPQLSQLAFLADAPGSYSSTVPSIMPFSIQARHASRVNVCFVDGHVSSFDGIYAGAGKGDPHRADLRWETLTDGVNQAPIP